MTRHNGDAQTRDESLLVDIDLAILGADADAYDEFEKHIRLEYRMVPSFICKKKRVALLQSFLEKPRIYTNEPFFSRLEAQARLNLANAIVMQ